MQISKDLKLHLSCAKDELRPALNGVYYDGKQLVATNGHILTRIKLPESDYEELESPQIIPGKVFQEITKGKKSEQAEFNLDGDKVIIGSNGSTQSFDCIKGNEFPNFEQVMPEESKPVFKLKFNTKLIKDLAAALGSSDDMVTLIFTNDNLDNDGEYLTCVKAIPVEVKSDDGLEKDAILMPARL